MNSTTALPSRVSRALHADETVAALVSASRPTGQSLPVEHWLVVTNRRLLAISRSRWSLDARLSRTITLSRLGRATMLPASGSMARARLELLGRRSLEVEVPLGEQEKLEEFVNVVQAATAQHSTMLTATGVPG